MDVARGRHAGAFDRSTKLLSRIAVIGVGPAGLDRLSSNAVAALTDPGVTVIARTLSHPAIDELAKQRTVLAGDDLYEQSDSFEDVYEALAQRVVKLADAGPVVFAVPGSPSVGEFTVPRLRRLAQAEGHEFTIMGAESFVDVICAELGIDPIERGLQVLDARQLPDPLPLHVPTIIAQVDVAVVAADVLSRLSELLGDDATVTVAIDVGSPEARLEQKTIGELDPSIASLRTSLVVDPAAVGWLGVVEIMRHLRLSCPWDREQTHHSIVANLTEEAAELADALSALPVSAPEGTPDFGAYADVEEELGDVLLQVLFHVVMGEQAEALRPDAVAQVLIDKLVRRHPHVFGDESAETADEVLGTWERAKSAEKHRATIFDGVPSGLAALGKAEKVQQRAATVGFDWTDSEPVYAKLAEEIDELQRARTPAEQVHELGDVLFTVVNLARKLGIGPEVALRQTVDRFQRRMMSMETKADLAALTPDELETLWESAKSEEE